MERPRVFAAAEAPACVAQLVAELLPKLLDGDHPALVALRAQLRHTRVTDVEWTGVGFFANFLVEGDVPLADPPNLTGGDAVIEVSGVEHGAGCVLFVRHGRLSIFEAYVNGGEPWTEDARVTGISDVFPLPTKGPT